MALFKRKRAIGRAEPKENHTGSWQEALDKALAEASAGLGPGQYNVEIRWRAHLDVKNPGQILSYEVVLERKKT
jgi:hypothetical protein